MRSFSETDAAQNERITALESKIKSNTFAIKVALVLSTAAFTFCVGVAFF